MWWRFVLVLLLALTLVGGGLSAQQSGKTVEWRTYGGDLASTRYSPLDLIDRDNFRQLEVAWRFKTDNLGPAPVFNFQATPLMVNGVMYTTAGSRRAVVAMDAATGEMLWMHRFDEGKRGEVAPASGPGKGLAYWDDGGSGRIFYVTLGYQLMALDARTGAQISSFGQNGIVDLKENLDQNVDPLSPEIRWRSAPIVARGVVVVGAAGEGGQVPSKKEKVKGYIRGFDARTGKRRWIFHTVPQAGEFGNDTWLNDSWHYTGNTGVWANFSVDEELGYVYLPIEMPTGDYYGGHRPGDNLFADSLVAVDIETGKRIWHYQFIHHDMWDWDIPCAPILADITVNGRAIKAIAQPTKQGWVYVFDRTNGRPVWPIEERPVPKGDVPGEWYAPTQPFPTQPPAFEQQGISLDDLIDFTPALRAEAVKIVSQYRLGPIFTPPALHDPKSTLGTLFRPTVTGGANWQGGSLDPETGILYVYSKNEVMAMGLISDPKRSNMDFIGGHRTDSMTVQGLPLVRPPWGRITAIDLNKGEIVWQVAHGETPDSVREHPALQGIKIPRTGRVGRIGTLTTKTLLIAGEGGFNTTPQGQRGAMLRAYDKATGEEVGAVFMPAPQTGSPMTYMLNGTQYIVLAIGGGAFPGELIAFRLPRVKTPAQG